MLKKIVGGDATKGATGVATDNLKKPEGEKIEEPEFYRQGGEIDQEALKEKGSLDINEGSAYAFVVKGGARPKKGDRVELPAFVDVQPIAAETITELLALLPEQTEIRQLTEQVAQPDRVPLRSLEDLKAAMPAASAKAMEELPQLTRFFNPVELYTADNITHVKELFLKQAEKGRPENPQLTYRQGVKNLRDRLEQDGKTLEEVEARLLQMKKEIAAQPVGDKVGQIMTDALLHKVDDDLATIQLAYGLEQGDDRAVKKAFGEKYGQGVDDALLKAANTVFSYMVAQQAHSKKGAKLGGGTLPKELVDYMNTKETMPADAFKDAVVWMLDRYYSYYEQKTGKPFPEGAKFKVELSDEFSGIDVRDKSSSGPIIGIPIKDRSYKKYVELMRHEVDQHVRQSLNGQLMFGLGGGALKVDEETWYEGLAMQSEIAFKREVFGDESQPSHPYYIFAVKMAEEGKSFVEVFEAVKQMRLDAGSTPKISAKNAWIQAYRVFRGHSDLSNKEAFAMPKDLAYLRGWMLQSQLKERGLGHINEATIAQLDGLSRIAQFALSPDDLIFPDLNLTEVYFEEVMRPKIEAAMNEEAQAIDGR